MAPITSRLHSSHSGFPQFRQYATASVLVCTAQFIVWLLRRAWSQIVRSRFHHVPGCNSHTASDVRHHLAQTSDSVAGSDCSCPALELYSFSAPAHAPELHRPAAGSRNSL